MKYIFALFTLLVCLKGFTQGLNEKLYIAVADKEIKKVEKLIDKGADPKYIRRINSAFFIPVLMQAVMDNSTEIAKILINKGANVNERDGFKMTCLMWAANNGNIELVKLLVEKGADIQAKDDNGLDAIKSAKDKLFSEIVEFLESKLKTRQP